MIGETSRLRLNPYVPGEQTAHACENGWFRQLTSTSGLLVIRSESVNDR